MPSILLGLKGLQTTRYARLASNSIIIFDHAMTFDREVELIWKSRWSFPKILFLLNRYYGVASIVLTDYSFFATSFENSLCLRLYLWEGWRGLIGCMLAQGILQIRIYALYIENKRVIGIMLVSFVFSSAASAWVIGSSLSTIAAFPLVIPGGEFCYTPTVPPHLYAFWIPMLSFETLLCCLAVIRGVQAYKAHGLLFTPFQRLHHVLIRDSLIYFLAIGIAYLSCLVVWLLETNILLEVSVGFALAFSCTLGSRMILNIRDANLEQVELSRVPTPLEFGGN